MSTESNQRNYFVRLRESLWQNYDEKVVIKRIARDAAIELGDVILDGPPRSAWEDIICNARKQRKLRRLIELAVQQYPEDAGLQSSLAEYHPELELLSTVTIRDSNWPPMVYHEVDRVEQLDTLHQAVHQSSGRPLIAIWCGDELARHDILKRRIKSLPLMIDGRGLNPLFKECPVGNDVPGDLRRSCFEFLRTIPTESSDSLQPLLVSKDFSRHLLTLIVDLTWDGNTCQQITEILDWCRQIGPLSEDRRFVIAVAIEVRIPRRLFSFLWRKDRISAVREAHAKLRGHIANHAAAILLPPLSDIGLNHLRAWRTEMENRYGPRPDDSLGDPRLSQIVPLQELRPMQDIVTALEVVFTSHKT